MVANSRAIAFNVSLIPSPKYPSGKDAVVLARRLAAAGDAITGLPDSTTMIDVAHLEAAAVIVHAAILAPMAIVIEVRDASITMTALATALRLVDRLPWMSMAHLAAVMMSRIDGTTFPPLLPLLPILMPTVANTIDLRGISLHESPRTHREMGMLASMTEADDTDETTRRVPTNDVTKSTDRFAVKRTTNTRVRLLTIDMIRIRVKSNSRASWWEIRARKENAKEKKMERWEGIELQFVNLLLSPGS